MPKNRSRRRATLFFDLYGHTPTQLGTYKTWTGFVLSILLFCAVGVSCSYVLFEYFTLPYNLAEAKVPYDESFAAQPESHPAVPDVSEPLTQKARSQRILENRLLCNLALFV